MADPPVSAEQGWSGDIWRTVTLVWCRGQPEPRSSVPGGLRRRDRVSRRRVRPRTRPHPYRPTSRCRAAAGSAAASPPSPLAPSRHCPSLSPPRAPRPPPPLPYRLTSSRRTLRRGRPTASRVSHSSREQRYFTLAFLETLGKRSCTLAWNGDRTQTVANGRGTSPTCSRPTPGPDPLLTNDRALPKLWSARSPVRGHQKTLTPNLLSTSVTGWKNVVPPVRQSPLPPEVSPSATLPAYSGPPLSPGSAQTLVLII